MAQLTDRQVEHYAKLLIEKISQIEGDWSTPWVQPIGNSPQNIDGRLYHGLNQMMLYLHSSHNQFEHPAYITFLRAKEENINIKAGEKSFPITYTSLQIKHKETGEKLKEEAYKLLSKEEKEEYNVSRFFKVSNVFNIAQTDIQQSRPELYLKITDRLSQEATWENSDRSYSSSQIDKLIDEQAWICPIHLDESRSAYYRPSSHSIHLPNREQFRSNEDFYSTTLHEMAHSTAPELSRDISGKFGDASYAREELVAELSSSITGLEHGLPKNILESNSQYLKNWLQVLKEEPEYIREVLEDVVQASNLMLKHINNQSITKGESVIQEQEAKNSEQDYEYRHFQYREIGYISQLDKQGEVIEKIPYYNEELFIKDLTEELNNNFQGTRYEVISPTANLLERLDRLNPIDNRHRDDLDFYEKKSQELLTSQGNYQEAALLRMYAQPQLMNKVFTSEYDLTDSRLAELIEHKETAEQKGNSTERANLEDAIREFIKEAVSVKLPDLPNLSTKEDLIQRTLGKEQLSSLSLSPIEALDLSKDKGLMVQVKEPINLERLDILNKGGTQVEDIGGGMLQYEAKIRYREGFIVPNIEENESKLKELEINAIPLGSSKLFIPSSDKYIDRLLSSDLELSSTFGIGSLPKMSPDTLKQRIESSTELTPIEKEELQRGELVYRQEQNGRNTTYLYYIDKELNQVRKENLESINIPNKIGSIEISPESSRILTKGLYVRTLDKDNYIHYQIEVDPREASNLSLRYSQSLMGEFKLVPTIQSPEKDKEEYIALKGAEAIDEIWGKEGIKQERDDFLEKHHIQDAYREYLKLQEAGEVGSSLKQNEAIKETLRQQEQRTQSLQR